MTSHELVQELRKSSLCGHNLSTNYWYFSDSDAVNLIEARDTTIRAECADRAVEAIGNIRPSQRSEWELVEKALRAAIEGGQDA